MSQYVVGVACIFIGLLSSCVDHYNGLQRSGDGQGTVCACGDVCVHVGMCVYVGMCVCSWDVCVHVGKGRARVACLHVCFNAVTRQGIYSIVLFFFLLECDTLID